MLKGINQPRGILTGVFLHYLFVRVDHIRGLDIRPSLDRMRPVSARSAHLPLATANRITGMTERENGVVVVRGSRTPILDQRAEKNLTSKR